MNVYAIDVPVFATIYVKAKDTAEAGKIIAENMDRMIGLHVEGGWADGLEISGDAFDDPTLPSIHLSPAMTIPPLHEWSEVVYELAHTCEEG